MHEDVKKFADGKDIKRLRYIFVDCLDVDPTFEKYAEDFEYCRNVAGLFEAHTELTPFINSHAAWNMDYWTNLKTDLLKNFSLKRFEHMIEVAKVVYAEKIVRLEAERSKAAQKIAGQSPSPNRDVSLSMPDSNAEVLKKNQSLREEQQKALDEDTRKQEEAYQRQLAEEERQKMERRAKMAGAEQQGNFSNGGSAEPKKAMGIVPVAVAILVILLILVIVLT